MIVLFVVVFVCMIYSLAGNDPADVRKRSRVIRLRHCLPINTTYNYACRFAQIVNTHSTDSMRHFFNSLADVENVRVIKHALVSTPPKTSAKASKKQSISSTGQRDDIPLHYGRLPYQEFTELEAYLQHFDGMMAASPDAIFTILSVRSFQTYEATVVLLGFTLTSTLITVKEDNSKKAAPNQEEEIPVTLSEEKDETCDGLRTLAEVGCSMDSLDDGSISTEAEKPLSLNHSELYHTKRIPPNKPLVDPALISSVVSLQTVRCNGSVALYFSNITGKLYRVEFFWQYLTDSSNQSSPSSATTIPTSHNRTSSKK